MAGWDPVVACVVLLGDGVSGGVARCGSAGEAVQDAQGKEPLKIDQRGGQPRLQLDPAPADPAGLAQAVTLEMGD